MILAKNILKTIEKHNISENRVSKSKTSKFDGKVVECDSFLTHWDNMWRLNAMTVPQLLEKS